MPTIQDVAKREEVGSITVSRVINKSGYIRSETRERFQKAMVELGYVTNSQARGVKDAANEAGDTVIICNADKSTRKEAKYLNVLLQKMALAGFDDLPPAIVTFPFFPVGSQPLMIREHVRLKSS